MDEQHLYSRDEYFDLGEAFYAVSDETGDKDFLDFGNHCYRVGRVANGSAYFGDSEYSGGLSYSRDRRDRDAETAAARFAPWVWLEEIRQGRLPIPSSESSIAWKARNLAREMDRGIQAERDRLAA